MLQGTKPVLMERLQQALQEEEEQEKEGKPSLEDGGKLQEGHLPLGASASSMKSGRRDAVSETGSCRSGKSTASAMALEAARRAGLEAKLKMLKQKHELEEKEREIKQKKEETEIQIEIAQAKATEEALAQSLNGSSSSSITCKSRSEN